MRWQRDWRAAFRVWLPPLMLGLWPFVYFLPVVCPGTANCLGIGNDFLSLYYRYKAYLLDSLVRLRMPLWSPSEAAGFPFYSNPFAQAFYPLNLPLAVFYAVAGGYAPLDHQRFTVFGVSILCVGLYLWLRSLGLPLRAALVAAAVMSVSFKVAEVLRFPNAVHTAAWYPWILYGITRVVQAPRPRQKLWGAGVLVAAGICLMTAGYPYYVYYTLFLVGPYIVLLMVPRLSAAMGTARAVRPLASAAFLAGSAVTALLVCAPYLLKMVQLLDQTTDRQGNSFQYATAHRFTLEDTLGSLLYPPAAQTEGWMYFSMTALLLALLYLLAGPRQSRGERSIFVLWIAGISSLACGAASPVFRIAWNTLPFFSRLRVWGRLHIVLVPVLAWLLARAFVHLEISARDRARTLLVWLLVAYTAVLGTQASLFVRGRTDVYWDYYFLLTFWPVESRFLWFGVVGLSALVAAIGVLGMRSFGQQGRAWAVALGLVAIASVDMAQMGNRLWSAPGVTRERQPFRVDLAPLESLDLKRTATPATITLGRHFSVGTVSNWYFQRYLRFLQSVGDEPKALSRLLGVSRPRRLFFTRRIAYSSVAAFLSDSEPFSDAIRILSYDGDRLSVDVDEPTAGYLSFIDNWDPDWRAAVDGRPQCIEPLFGTFKAVRVPEGAHNVTFSYRPYVGRRSPCHDPG